MFVESTGNDRSATIDDPTVRGINVRSASRTQLNLDRLMENPFLVEFVPASAERTCRRPAPSRFLLIGAALILLLAAAAVLQARDKNKLPYGEGLIVNLPFPEAQVEQVVRDITQNGLIRGTKEYNKDQYVGGAQAADSTHAFPDWTEGGKVFYKVRLQAIDPRNFRDSTDVGTLAVRYVLQPQGDKNTVLRIDAVFVEDFRKIVHPSDGTVESSEYKDIRDHLDAMAVMKEQTVEAEKERQELAQKKQLEATSGGAAPAATPVAAESVAAGPEYSSSVASAPVPSAPPLADPLATTVSAPPTSAMEQTPGQTLEQRVKDLRHQVERLVRSPGAPLKSAPFHTASVLNPLQPGTEVLILISTPYWYGVETHQGEHGWLSRDDVEPLP